MLVRVFFPISYSLNNLFIGEKLSIANAIMFVSTPTINKTLSLISLHRRYDELTKKTNSLKYIVKLFNAQSVTSLVLLSCLMQSLQWCY